MSSAPRRLASLGVKSVAVALDALRPAPRGVTVLLYHRVGRRTPVPVDLALSAFGDQMAQVAGRAVTLDVALGLLSTPGDMPADRSDDPVVVTFDDGTADVVEEALPILAHHGVPALLYVATDFVERGVEFPNQGRPVSWAALGDAIASGWLSVGSHTHTHALLDRAAPAIVSDELARSVGLIEDRLGVACHHFAYPKALAGSPAADAAVRARFASAALAGTRSNPYGTSDPWRLARTPIQQADTAAWFQRKVAGGLRFEDDLRRLINRRRYASATT